MLAVQQQMWASREEARHNRAAEVEMYRHNLATEQLGISNLSETQRTNMANEGIRAQSNAITADHYGRMDAETHRTNVANEGIKSDINAINMAHYERQDTETSMHNRNVEAESYRSNRANELNTALSNKIQDKWITGKLNEGQQNVAIAQQNATTNAANATTNARNADINAANVKVAERNAAINQQNANTRVAEAVTGGYNDVLTGVSAPIRAVGSLLGD